MKYKLSFYDYQKLQEAKSMIERIAEYHYNPSSPLSNRLETILNKLQKLLEDFYTEVP